MKEENVLIVSLMTGKTSHMLGDHIYKYLSDKHHESRISKEVSILNKKKITQFLKCPKYMNRDLVK
jgi:hypothetical protein